MLQSGTINSFVLAEIVCKDKVIVLLQCTHVVNVIITSNTHRHKIFIIIDYFKEKPKQTVILHFLTT